MLSDDRQMTRGRNVQKIRNFIVLSEKILDVLNLQYITMTQQILLSFLAVKKRYGRTVSETPKNLFDPLLK